MVDPVGETVVTKVTAAYSVWVAALKSTLRRGARRQGRERKAAAGLGGSPGR